MQPKPDNKNYDDLRLEIKKGIIKLPKFQRDFVWSIEASAKLLDSILKGYPIGTMILWKTRERLRTVKNLGGSDLPEVPPGDSVMYVLDGQQRLASLYVATEGLKVEKNKKTIDYSEIYVNLDNGINTDDNVVTTETDENHRYINFNSLISNKLTYFFEHYKDYIDKIESYREIFSKYQFSVIILNDYSIDEAVNVFTRINTTGTELTLFEIMTAKTYDEDSDFDLYEKYKDLSSEFHSIGYDTISSSTILQCHALNLEDDARRQSILKLDKDKFIEHWDETIESVRKAIDYFRTVLRVPVSRLLPYTAILAPISYFYYNHPDPPDTDQIKMLNEYFWRASLSKRYSSAVETKLGQDVKKISKIIKSERPSYDFKVFLDKDQIKYWWFSTSDSYCKAILCLYAYFEPKSFNNNQIVILDNSWLVQSFSKNYHHFFPRSYLKNNGHKEYQNTISNITLVDDHLNKRKIGSKAPSIYMKDFVEDNPDIVTTMETHLIGDLKKFGIWEDDYEKFIDKRSERIVQELEKRINIDI